MPKSAGREGTATRKRRPGPRGRKAALAGTKEDLLRAGAAVFAERGFDGATADALAQRAGTTKAMINYHFRSKQGLYEAILRETFTPLAGRLEAVRAGGGSAPDQLRAFIETFAAAAEANPHFPPMMLREILSGGRHLPPPIYMRMVGVVSVVRSIVEQGMAEGSFRKVDSLLTHLSVMGVLLIFFATEPFRRKAVVQTLKEPPPATAAFVAHVQELMVRGLAAEAAPNKRS